MFYILLPSDSSLRKWRKTIAWDSLSEKEPELLVMKNVDEEAIVSLYIE